MKKTKLPFFCRPIRPPPNTGDTHCNVRLQTQHHGQVSDKCNHMELCTFKKHNPQYPTFKFFQPHKNLTGFVLLIIVTLKNSHGISAAQNRFVLVISL